MREYESNTTACCRGHQYSENPILLHSPWTVLDSRDCISVFNWSLSGHCEPGCPTKIWMVLNIMDSYWFLNARQTTLQVRKMAYWWLSETVVAVRPRTRTNTQSYRPSEDAESTQSFKALPWPQKNLKIDKRLTFCLQTGGVIVSNSAGERSAFSRWDSQNPDSCLKVSLDQTWNNVHLQLLTYWSYTINCVLD